MDAVITQRYWSQRAPAELGRRLQLIQGAQWLSAIGDDPYARVLRGFDDDPYPLYERLGRAGPMVSNRAGVWVTASRALATEIMVHPGFGPMTAGSPYAPYNVVPLDEDIVHAVPHSAASLVEPVTRVVDSLTGEVDLVGGFATRICAEVLAETFDVPLHWLVERIASTGVAVDAALCPQSLAATRRMLSALDDLRDRLGDPGAVLLTVVGAQVATTLLGNTLDMVLDEPSRASRVVDETLSLRPPVHLHALIARSDLDFGGARVTAGDQVVVLVGAVNRDGAGAPLLLGPPYAAVFPFARVVTETALSVLTERFPSLRRTGPVLRRRRAPVTRVLLRLPASIDVRDEAR
ncbi:hypothetical protein [Micromonospora sp. LOL_024]|uniref:cytochrome P450 family protein n=1 Tax=Micromonospora sp. LOL_024 TaxID=3345412 RepID=UPI003A8585FB